MAGKERTDAHESTTDQDETAEYVRTAKRLALVLGAVLLVLILVIALFPLLDSVGKPYEVTTYAMGSYVQQSVYGDNSEEAAVAAADAIQALENEISWRVSGSDVQKPERTG